MPHILPEAIVQQVQAAIPSTHKMWWVRGIVLGAQEVRAPEGMGTVIPATNTKVQVLDVDTKEDAYDITLLGEGYDLANGDTISLLGHEPLTSKAISVPRFFFNHNTGTYTHAYSPDIFYENTWNSTEFKNWLGCKNELSRSARRKKMAGLGALFFISIILTSGATLIIAWLLVMMGIPLLAIRHFAKRAAEPKAFAGSNRRTGESNLWYQFRDYLGHSYKDITDLYQKVGSAVDDWVEDHPDMEKGFVMVARGRSKQGVLPDGKPAKGALPE